MQYRVSNEDERCSVVRIIRAIDLKKPHSVELKQIRKRRSNSANATYWMWITCLCQDLTSHSDKESISEYHDYFREKYLPVRLIRLPDGSGAKVLTSTTKLDSKQMSAYMENVRMDAIQAGVDLPDPGTRAFDQMCEFYDKLTK